MKSLTKEFVVFRNNAIQRRRFRGHSDFGEASSSSAHDNDVWDTSHLLNVKDSYPSGSSGPPSYVGQCEALQYQMGRLEAKVDQLDALHKLHLSRPTLDDESREEAEIKAVTRDVTEMFCACHRQLKIIRRNTMLSVAGVESVITRNLVNYLVSRLQSVTEKFTKSQNAYLNKIKSREEKSKQFLVDFDDVENTVAQSSSIMNGGEELAWEKHDVFALEENTRFVKQRELHVQAVVQSIADLNQVFKELAGMVVDQGSIVDRIEHNIDNAHVKVEAGLKELKKANEYQKKNLKMHCIVILAVIVILLLIILILTKT